MIVSLKMALRSIGSNKMRAVLTMLGIIIGVMALVVLVSLVNGATTSVTDAVAGLGSSLITAKISDDKGNPITLEDLESWMEKPETFGAIAPIQTTATIAKHGSNYSTMTLYGTTPAYYDVQDLQLSMGRWLKSTDVDNHTNVCIINETAATELIGYEDCIGQTVLLNNTSYTVVGVLQNNDDSLTSILTAGAMAAYVPYTSLVRLSGMVSEDITTFYISAPEGGVLETAENAMDEILLDRFENDEDAFSLSSQAILEEAMNSITSVLSSSLISGAMLSKVPAIVQSL